MAETNLEKKAASLYTILVTMTWGVHIVRYCRNPDNIVIGADTFLAEPALHIEGLVMDGGTEDKPPKLTIPKSRSPFDRISTGFKHQEVKVVVEQMDPSDVTTRRHLHLGWVGISRLNPAGKAGYVKVELPGIKQKLKNVKLSVIATTTCDLRFGGRICRVDASAWTRTGTVTSIDRNIVVLNLTGITDPPNELPNERYRKGVLVVDGLELGVKRSLEDGSFALFPLAPPWIVGQTCTLYAGCGKRIEDCRLWDNEKMFRGVAIHTPTRNPIFEEG